MRNGGTGVVMGQFPAFVNPQEMKPFFGQVGLPWSAASYTRSTHVLNRESLSDKTAACLAPQISQKALSVNNVSGASAWYIADDGYDHEDDESSRPAPKTTKTMVEAAVAFARVGEGKLGYIGDVNAEQDLNAVILAMCGILN